MHSAHPGMISSSRPGAVGWPGAGEAAAPRLAILEGPLQQETSGRQKQGSRWGRSWLQLPGWPCPWAATKIVHEGAQKSEPTHETALACLLLFVETTSWECKLSEVKGSMALSTGTRSCDHQLHTVHTSIPPELTCGPGTCSAP